MRIPVLLLTAVVLTCIAGTAKSHEFWIEPLRYQVAAGEEIAAHLRVGEVFEGAPMAYIPRRFTRFDYALKQDITRMPGRLGDLPAVGFTPEGAGLVTIIHQSTHQRLVWSSWEKFERFLAHKDLDFAVAAHAERGLSRDGVIERYSRYAKSLIAIGPGQGADYEAGLEVELVALENPYLGGAENGLQIKALYQGRALADTQVEVFEKSPDGAVRVFLERTDGDGRASIPVQPGRRYMLDAVVLRPLPAKTPQSPVWESLWANLTFAVPAE